MSSDDKLLHIMDQTYKEVKFVQITASTGGVLYGLTADGVVYERYMINGIPGSLETYKIWKKIEMWERIP